MLDASISTHIVIMQERNFREFRDVHNLQSTGSSNLQT